jgi:hypothetical protein
LSSEGAKTWGNLGVIVTSVEHLIDQTVLVLKTDFSG